MWRRQEARADLAVRFWDLAGGRPGWRIADVGCGPGRFAIHYASLTGPTGHVHAVDVDADALAYLRARLDPAHHAHVTTEQLDILDAPLPDLRFHVLFCTATLHHVVDLDEALANLRASDAPLLVAEFDPAGPGDVGPPLDQRLSVDELSRALRRTGFAVDAITRVPHETYVVLSRPVSA